MARSEKDRALLFLACASVTEYVRADAFILCASLSGRACGSVLQEVLGYEAYGFTLTFLSIGCRIVFHCQDFRDILRVFFVAQPETDVIMNGGLVQVHKLYIIFHIKRLMIEIGRASCRERV